MQTSVLQAGPAAFYGVVGIERMFHEARKRVERWYYVDNAYFDAARGTHFRVGVDAQQASGLETPDWPRAKALGLAVKPWTRNGRHVLVVMQSDHFLRHVGGFAGGGMEYQQQVLGELKKYTDRPMVVRHWLRDKTERARTLQQDLAGAWALVTHSSAAANEALLAGVPVFLTGPSAALPMGLSQLSAIEYPRRCEGREAWAAALAGRQWTLDELREGTAWRTLHQ